MGHMAIRSLRDQVDVKRFMTILCTFLQANDKHKKLKPPSNHTAPCLQEAGYDLELLGPFCTVPQALEIGFTLQECADADMTTGLCNTGLSVQELSKVAFTQRQLQQGGFTVRAFKDAGFRLPDL